jgi:hypothetical protein
MLLNASEAIEATSSAFCRWPIVPASLNGFALGFESGNWSAILVMPRVIGKFNQVMIQLEPGGRFPLGVEAGAPALTTSTRHLRSAFKTGVSPDQLQNVLDRNDKPFISRISVDEASLKRNFEAQGDAILAEPIYIALQMAEDEKPA